MINVNNEKAKQRIRAQMERRWIVFQNAFMKQILSILKRQYADVAKNIASYSLDYNFAIIKHSEELRNIYRKHYMRVLKEFGESGLAEVSKFKGIMNYQTKSFIDDFWRFAIPWINDNTAAKVVAVNETTKNLINNIVRREMQDDNSNRDIAKKIKEISEISNPFRAMRIARTETHSAANFATNQAMDSSGMMKEKEWVSALDERTRTIFNGSNFDHVAANGERVAMDDSFKKTGENLMFPGDFSGSAGNIINCRCVSLFHTNVQVGGVAG